MRGRVGKVPGEKVEIPEPKKPVEKPEVGAPPSGKKETGTGKEPRAEPELDGGTTRKAPKVHDPRVKNPGVGSGNGGGDKGPKRTRDQVLVQRIEMVLLLRKGWSRMQIAEFFGLSPSQITHDWKAALKELRETAYGDELEEMVAVQEERLHYVIREALEAWEKSKADAWKKVVEEDNRERVCTVCRGSGKVFGGNGGSQGRGNGGSGAGSSQSSGKNGGSRGGSKIGGSGSSAADGKDCFYCGGKGSKPATPRVTTTKEGQCGDARYLQTALQAYSKLCTLRGLNPTKKIDITGGGLDWSILFQNVPADGKVPDAIEEEIARIGRGEMGGGSRAAPGGGSGPFGAARSRPAVDEDDGED